jgi:hypothetical protein
VVADAHVRALVRNHDFAFAVLRLTWCRGKGWESYLDHFDECGAGGAFVGDEDGHRRAILVHKHRGLRAA